MVQKNATRVHAVMGGDDRGASRVLSIHKHFLAITEGRFTMWQLTFYQSKVFQRDYYLGVGLGLGLIFIKNLKGFRNVRKSIETGGDISQYFDPSHFFEDQKS